MEFAAMKRRELLELCRQHGLATRRSKADLAASLADALSVASAATAENVVEVVVGKGCLKGLGGSASGGTSGAAKKVRFALGEKSEERARRRRSQVILQPVITKARGRRKAKKVLPAAAVSGRGWRRKRDDVGGDSADEDVGGEAGADAPVTLSRMKMVCLRAHRGVESQNNPAGTEEEWEVVGAAIDRKQKRKNQENAEVIAANAQAGISRRITRRSNLSAAAVLLSTNVEKKRGRRKARDGKGEISAEGQSAEVQDLTTAASPVIVESRRNSRKGEDCIPSVQKPSKVVVSCSTTRSSSVAATVMLPTIVGNKRRKTRGRPKARETLPTAARNGRGSWRKHDVGGDFVDHGSFGEVGADAPVTQSGTKVVNFCAESGVESRNNPAEAEEEVEVIGAPTYRKRKIQENAEDIAANAQAGVCHRSTRKSSSPTSAVLLSAVVDKKMEVGDGMDELGVKELAEVKVLATAALPIISESRSKRKGEDSIPAELKPTKVEVYGRTIHSVAAAVLLPTVIGNKVRKPEDVHPNGELPTYLEVPRNDAPVTRSLRNRIVQVNNSLVEETRVGKKLEIKSKPSRRATCRHQPLLFASSVVEKEQVAAPCKLPQHTQSRTDHPLADELLSNADSETNKLNRAPVEAKDLKITQPLTRNTAKTSMEDVVLMAEKEWFHKEEHEKQQGS